MSDFENEGGTQTVTRDKTRLKRPKLFKVLLINDDYTTMDFVVSVLETIFKKSPAEATQIMLQVHEKGSGVCGIFPRQIAEAKVEAVRRKARAAGYPLQCHLEEA